MPRQCDSCDETIHSGEFCDMCTALEHSYWDRKNGDELAEFQRRRAFEVLRQMKLDRRKNINEVRFSGSMVVFVDWLARATMKSTIEPAREGPPVIKFYVGSTAANRRAFTSIWRLSSLCTLWRNSVIYWVRSRGIVLSYDKNSHASWKNFMSLLETDREISAQTCHPDLEPRRRASKRKHFNLFIPKKKK